MCSLRLNFSNLNNLKHQSMEENLTSLYATKYPTKFFWVTHASPLIFFIISVTTICLLPQQDASTSCFQMLATIFEPYIGFFYSKNKPLYIIQILIMLFHCLGKTKHLRPKGDPLTWVLDLTPPTSGLTTDILKNMYINHKKTLKLYIYIYWYAHLTHEIDILFKRFIYLFSHTLVLFLGYFFSLGTYIFML